MHGNLAPDLELAPQYRQNFPHKIESLLKPIQAKGHFAPFLFGIDFPEEEMAIGGSLKAFAVKKKPAIIKCLAAEMFRPVPPQAEPLLKRMQLDKPKKAKDKYCKKLCCQP